MRRDSSACTVHPGLLVSIGIALDVKSSPVFALVAVALFALCSIASSAVAQAREEITIYRDEFGTPHIFAATAEGACFGHGYAQADDRLEELLKQYLRATGTMSEAFGPDFLHDDYRQRLWQHAAIAKAKYGELSAKSRGHDRSVSGRRQAVHERTSLGSARLGARDRTLDVRRAVRATSSGAGPREKPAAT